MFREYLLKKLNRYLKSKRNLKKKNKNITMNKKTKLEHLYLDKIILNKKSSY